MALAGLIQRGAGGGQDIGAGALGLDRDIGGAAGTLADDPARGIRDGGAAAGASPVYAQKIRHGDSFGCTIPKQYQMGRGN
ncbi:MAG: hypothetical protein Q4615_11290 [Paracoccus aminovorans]|nr:hypothetical protein [Paracoccus aminovorans]